MASKARLYEDCGAIGLGTVAEDQRHHADQTERVIRVTGASGSLVFTRWDHRSNAALKYGVALVFSVWLPPLRVGQRFQLLSREDQPRPLL